MGILDIIILLCLAGAAIGGIRKGIISQLVGVAVLIVSVWASVKFSVLVSGWLAGFVTDAKPAVLKVLSFVVIFSAVALVLGLLGRILEKCVKLTMLGWLNHVLGALLALTACSIFIGLVISLFDTLYSQFALSHDITEAPKFVQASIFYDPLHRFATWLFPYLSKLSI